MIQPWGWSVEGGTCSTQLRKYYTACTQNCLCVLVGLHEGADDILLATGHITVVLVYSEVLRFYTVMRTEMGFKCSIVGVVNEVGRVGDSHKASIQDISSDTGCVCMFREGKQREQGTTQGAGAEGGRGVDEVPVYM